MGPGTGRIFAAGLSVTLDGEVGMRRWLVVATVLTTVVVPQSATAASGGLRLAVNGCGYARVTMPRAFPGRFSVNVEKSSSYVGVLIFGDRTPGSRSFASAVVAPAVRTSPMRAAGAETLPAGRYTVVLCGDRASAVRVTLPGFTGWRAVRLTPAGRPNVTVAPLGTAALETGIARGGFAAGARFKLMFLSLTDGLGASAAQMCIVPPGQVCAAQTSGFTPLFTTFGDTSGVHAFAAMHAPGPATDGVVELYSSRAYQGTVRSHLVVVSLPTP